MFLLNVQYNIDIRYVAVLLSSERQLLVSYSISKRDLAHMIIFTVAPTRKF